MDDWRREDWMHVRPLRMSFDEAREDLENRTLAKLGGDFARLIYLASTRDYNSGRYCHDGLAFRFTEEAAESALAAAHKAVFSNLARSRFQDFVRQFELYLHSESAQATDLLKTWGRLEPYRVLTPSESNPLTTEYFVSNVKIALAILQSRWKVPSQAEQSA
jgi:hypothetical protein